MHYEPDEKAGPNKSPGVVHVTINEGVLSWLGERRGNWFNIVPVSLQT